MDPVSRRGIWDILEQIKNEGRTIILTTHHLGKNILFFRKNYNFYFYLYIFFKYN